MVLVLVLQVWCCVVKHGLVTLVVIMVLKDAATFQVLFIVCNFSSRLLFIVYSALRTSLYCGDQQWRSLIYLNIKSAKCFCLLPVVLVSLCWSWSCKQRSWSCYVGLDLGLVSSGLILVISVLVLLFWFRFLKFGLVYITVRGSDDAPGPLVGRGGNTPCSSANPSTPFLQCLDIGVFDASFQRTPSNIFLHTTR